LSTVKRSASATTSHLEEELEALTVEFVGRIVATLKSASFGDVAALSPTLDGARVSLLSKASSPLGVRALSTELGVAPDLLTAPLKELRDAGRIAKHGDKRATTYSIA
jgi:hypothetical protein